MSDCLAHETIANLMEGNLSPEEAAAVDSHMDTCPECRALVVEVAKSSRVVPKEGAPEQGGEDVHDPTGAPRTLLIADEVIAARFRIRRKLGRGAMGIVYEADDQVLGQRVALKVLTTRDSRLLDRLRREVVLGRRITHPNVCRVYDMGQDQDVHFISMEFLSGETLDACLARGPLPVEQAWSILDQVGEALSVAHQHGVVHRDLKPANIMVAPDGKVTVMDFGLARDLTADRSHHGAVVGTPAYWAPEQARGEPATARSDIYSLAIIFSELVGGVRPRWGESPDLGGVPPRYRPLVDRALDLDPARRFASVEEVREAMTEVERGRARRRPYKRRFLILTGGLGLFLGGLFSVLLVETLHAVPASGAGSTLVAVEVVPPTAAIYVDGARRGRGVADLTFREGEADPVEVRVEQYGYGTVARSVGPDDGPVVRITLAAESPNPR